MNLLACQRYSYKFSLVNCSVLIVSQFLFTMHTLFLLIRHTQCAHDFYCGTAYILHTDFVFPKLTWQWCIFQHFVAILSAQKKSYCNLELISCKGYFYPLSVHLIFEAFYNYLKTKNTPEEKIKQEIALALNKGWLHF